jgi:alkylhydroperoxidase family enzyme
MPRIAPLEKDDEDPRVRAEIARIEAAYGRATNMKRTLARSPAALRALMQWYDLREEVRQFLGDRPTTLFAHAVSTATDCLICSTFFRRTLIDAGEDPEALVLDDREQAVVAFGRQLGADPNAVSDALYARLAHFLQPEELVTLTVFGGMMIATNVFNNALRVDLDQDLFAYRKGAGNG